MVDGPQRTVSDAGESKLIERIAARIGAPPRAEIWAGDDAAVVEGAGGRMLLTIDMLVEHIDFDLEYATGFDVGWKAIAVNASDIAAMCGTPGRAVIAVALRREVEVGWVDDFVDGLTAAARRYGLGLAGGDIGEGSEISVSVAMTGEVGPGGPVTRTAARPGDAIVVTGALGGAAGGLSVLRSGARGKSDAHERLALRHLRPHARVAEAAALARLGPTAMIDVSDGLAVDLANLVEASGVGCEVDPGLVPVDPDLAGAGIDDPLAAALVGGEDFELLFTIEDARLEPALGLLAGGDVTVTKIGRVTAGDRVLGDDPLSTWKERGWEHLRGR